MTRLAHVLAETHAIAAAPTVKMIQLYIGRHVIAAFSQSPAMSATGRLRLVRFRPAPQSELWLDRVES